MGDCNLMKEIFLNKRVKQTLTLLFATGFSMISLLGANFFLARISDTTTFGDFYFILNVYTFCQTILNFGLFQSLGRLTALSNDKHDLQGYYGIGLIISAVLYLLLLIVLGIYSFKSNMIFERNLQYAILSTLPLGWTFLLVNFHELYLQGVNRIDLLALSRFLPKFLFFLSLVLIYSFSITSTLPIFLLVYFLSFGITFFLIGILIKPNFNKIKHKIKRIFVSNRVFGFNIYLGALVAVGTSNLSGVLIGYFGVDNTSVGFYNIALQFSAPLALIPNIIATVFFKQFVSDLKIDRKLIVITFVITILCLLALIIIVRPLIVFVYGVEYLASASLTLYLGLGAILYGVSDFFNRFLLSKGRGKELRNISIIVGIALLFANVILIQFWGALGAAYSKIIAGSIYFIIVTTVYRKIRQ